MNGTSATPHPARGAVLASLAVFGALALPLILSGYDYGRAWSDQINYHVPAILHFAHGGGFRDYPSATLPGFHLLFAAITVLFPGNETALKLGSFLISALLVGILANFVARRAGSVLVSICLLLPLLVCLYFLPQGVWVVPDNLGWLTVLGVLLLAMRYRDSAGWYVGMSALLGAAVFIRQSNLWLCAPAVLSALAGSPREAAHDRRLLWTTLMLVPAVATLAGFAMLWQALTPPGFVAQHEGVNLAAWPFLVCIIGAYGVFYLPLLVEPIRAQWARTSCRRATLIGAVLGFVLAVVQPTDPDAAAGRVSGLWNLGRFGPDIHHRPISIALLATLGGMSVAIWYSLLPRRLGLGLLCTLLAFAMAQTVNHMAYERYYTPFVLMLLGMMSAQILSRGIAIRRWSVAPLVMLTVINALVLLRGLRG